jgi:hypothetical protein
MLIKYIPSGCKETAVFWTRITRILGISTFIRELRQCRELLLNLIRGIGVIRG